MHFTNIFYKWDYSLLSSGFSAMEIKALMVSMYWLGPFSSMCTVFRVIIIIVIRRRRSRSAAAYSRQTFPLALCRSVGPYVRACVGRSVCLSSALWKNGGSDPDAVWRHRSDRSMRQVVGFGNRSTGRGTFGGEFWARHCRQWGLTFATTRPSSQITLGRLVTFVVEDEC